MATPVRTLLLLLLMGSHLGAEPWCPGWEPRSSPGQTSSLPLLLKS